MRCIDSAEVVNEKFVANADPSVMQDSTLNLFMVASKDAIVMVEADAHQLSETIMLEALDFGYKTVQPLIKIQEELTKAVGKIKIKQPVKPAEVIDSAEVSKAVSLSASKYKLVAQGSVCIGK